MALVIYDWMFDYRPPGARRSEDLYASPDPTRYLAPMPIFNPETVQLVEAALRAGPEQGMTGKQVWEALERSVPEPTVHIVLSHLIHEGVVKRDFTLKGGRSRSRNVFRLR